ncbi:MAG: AAA family ATPase [Clostridiales bacterium]|nr:AAA family ATPase [Clostridiales bacterium]
MRGACSLDTIQIKNVRSLKDTGEVKLSPLTLLLGENSSGKSTFLRVFPLIKQSASKRTDGPLLWAGDVDDYVDFGSFAETVTNDGSNDMTFCFSFLADNYTGYYPSDEMEIFPEFKKVLSEKDQVHYAITIAQKSTREREYISMLNVQINDSKFEFELQQVPFAGTIMVDDAYHYIGKNPSSEDRGFYYSIGYVASSIFGYTLPNISVIIEDTLQKIERPKPKRMLEENEFRLIDHHYSYTARNILCSIGRLMCSKISWEEIRKAVEHRGAQDVDKYWDLVVRRLERMEKDELENFLAASKLIYFYEYFSRLDRYLERYFKQVHYIAPLRATAERYYRLRNLAIDEVDYQGKNLAIFLSGLPKKRLQEFQEWTKTYFGFSVKVIKSIGHLSVNIDLNDGGAPVNMSDTGFGYSQILPIITQIWDLSTSPQPHYGPDEPVPLVIAIEQPELHLHPALQARLTRAFIASIKLAEKNGYHLQLLIETHSETIVNCLGKAIAVGQLSDEDVSVILFDKDIQTRRTIVRTSGYDSEGYLDNWPIGFFSPKEW